ncbi:MAG: GTPase HflX [Candidatus Omnitrophica bacterium]|nr:GTPase HflX [Candidatus Omnitrophota bacterium]
MERILIVTVDLESEKSEWPIEDLSTEMEELVSACGGQIVDAVVCPRDRATPDLFIGKGKAEELCMLCEETGIDTVVFSHDLSGTQQRNLEAVIKKKTIDRTQLILDIFARHAASPEGKTQVELAQLQYLLPRLVGKGIELSRLGGGIGTRGPGEQKLEIDRRRIRKRIEKLKDELKHLSLHRQTIRKQRKDNFLPSVVLVGYTNAGKSTLLNSLTDAGQFVKDSLFTTLDPLSKSLKLSNGEKIVLSDTVGFLHKLPHHLIEAFKATLEEVTEADLLIHVLDVSHPRVFEYHEAVLQVLRELNADKKPLITVLNKIDLLEDKTWLEKVKEDFSNQIYEASSENRDEEPKKAIVVGISAKLKENLDELLARMQDILSDRMMCLDLILPHGRMDLVNILYEGGKVLEIDYAQEGVKIRVNMPKVTALKLLKNKDIIMVG